MHHIGRYVGPNPFLMVALALTTPPQPQTAQSVLATQRPLNGVDALRVKPAMILITTHP